MSRTVPLNIAKYRKRAGLSQAEMARQLRIRRETLSRLENGQQYLTEGMEHSIVHLLQLSDDERNHMLGFPYGSGTHAVRDVSVGGHDSVPHLVLVGAGVESES